jgi:hypothetical protein
MATPVHQGKAILFAVACHNPDGTLNTTAVMTIAPGNANNLTARMNPADNRQAGVLGLVSGTSVNVQVHAPTGPGGADRTSSMLFQVDAPLVDNSNAEFGALGAEVDPPSWLL